MWVYDGINFLFFLFFSLFLQELCLFGDYRYKHSNDSWTFSGIEINFKFKFSGRVVGYVLKYFLCLKECGFFFVVVAIFYIKCFHMWLFNICW